MILSPTHQGCAKFGTELRIEAELQLKFKLEEVELKFHEIQRNSYTVHNLGIFNIINKVHLSRIEIP